MNMIKQYNFVLTYENDGVYLSIERNESNRMMTEGDLLTMLKDKDVQDVDFSAVNEVLQSGLGSIKCIAPYQEEKFKDDDLDVFAAPNKMEAKMIIIKGEDKGKRLSVDEVVKRLGDEYKIVSGIDTDMIGEMIDGGLYDEERVIAVGKPAVDGIPGEVTYHFETNFNKVGAEVGGRIDFKQLSLFANVSKGSVIASKTDPVPGIDGYDIYGKELKAKEGKEAKFLYGKNVFMSQNGDTLLAAIDGKADVVGNKVVVSKVYVINGNVDMSVGNIDFAGDIVINGNVMSGFEVKAGGSIDIYGIVEDAKIIAQENIRIAGGFLGNGKGSLEAGGSVFCKSVENGIINAGISVEADVVMHSNIYCNGTIKVCGEKSRVIGGNMCSSKEIILNNVGNIKGTDTNLKIGLPDDVFQRISDIEEEKKKLDMLLKELNRRKNDMLSSTEIDVNQKVKIMNSLLSTQKSLEKNAEEREKLDDIIESAKKGRIQIRGRGNNGVNIFFNNAVKRIELTVDFTTFVFKDGEIHEYPCS